MVYQGYVAWPLRKGLMEDAFIGRQAVALRIKMKMRIHALEYEILPALYQELTRKEDALSSGFPFPLLRQWGCPATNRSLRVWKRRPQWQRISETGWFKPRTSEALHR